MDMFTQKSVIKIVTNIILFIKKEKTLLWQLVKNKDKETNIAISVWLTYICFSKQRNDVMAEDFIRRDFLKSGTATNNNGLAMITIDSHRLFCCCNWKCAPCADYFWCAEKAGAIVRPGPNTIPSMWFSDCIFCLNNHKLESRSSIWRDHLITYSTLNPSQLPWPDLFQLSQERKRRSQMRNRTFETDGISSKMLITHPSLLF